MIPDMIGRRNLFLFFAVLTLIGASLACGFSASAPAASAPQATQPVSASSVELPTPSAAPYYFVIQPTSEATPSSPIPLAPPPAIPESRRLTLEYPPNIRTGDADVIRLTLEMDALGNLTPTAVIAGNTVAGATVQVPNLYDTHYVTAEARLDLAGVEVRPPESVNETLLPGQSVTFYWSVRPMQAGMYRGTAWLFLRFANKVSGEESRIALSAQTVQIEAANFFGLSGNAARAAGGLGSIVGAILGLPFADDVLKWLLGRLRKKS